MIQARVVPDKKVMEALILALKEAKISAEDIPVHMHQWKTSIKRLKDKGETPTLLMHLGQIN